MADIAGATVGVVAFLFWLSAFVHWILALGHRRPEIRLETMLMSGFKSYDATNFLPSGQKLHRRFLFSALAFAITAVGAFVVRVVLQRR